MKKLYNSLFETNQEVTNETAAINEDTQLTPANGISQNKYRYPVRAGAWFCPCCPKPDESDDFQEHLDIQNAHIYSTKEIEDNGHDGNGMDETDTHLPVSEDQVEQQNQISPAIDQGHDGNGMDETDTHLPVSEDQEKNGDKLRVTLVTNDDGWKILVTAQLIAELAENPSVKLSGLVARKTPELEEWVKELNLELVNPKEFVDFADEERLFYPPDSHDIDVMIIHSYGRNPGKYAQAIKDSKKCKWVHVVHTISEELTKYMEKEAGSQSGHQASEHDVQLKLCEIADIIIAIGPKVAEAYTAYLRSKKKVVFDLTPAVVHDPNDVRPVVEHGDIFRLVVSATYHEKYFSVKGIDIAAQAIGLLKDPSYHIIFIVLPGDDTKELQRRLRPHREFTTVRQINKNTKDLKELLCQVQLAILPARAVGFGTTCLSALSADVPVLVSGNTGLGMALRKLPSGANFVIDSKEPQDWANKIKEVREKGAKDCADAAQKLRKEYMKEFNLRKQCNRLVKKMFEMFPEKQESKKEGLEATNTMKGSCLQAAIQQTKTLSVSDEDNENGALAKFVPKMRVPENNDDPLRPEMIVAGFSGMRVEERLDEVDGLRTQQEPSSRLLTSVQNIPYPIRARICLKLNPRDDLNFRDFRLLGEKMNFDKDITRNLELKENPTDKLLQLWCSTRRTQPTVGCLIELLKDSDLERWDVVDILEKWVEDGVRE